MAKKVSYSTYSTRLDYPRNATEKSRVLGSWLFWLFVNTNITATMKMATIMSIFLNGNTSTDHVSLQTPLQSTRASTTRVFETMNSGLFAFLLALLANTSDCGRSRW